jgi:NAD(P)-dependent dehydrogenase (short-subunit alcohol dehydrogenase family)/uncharacterized membrane protein
VGAGDEQTKSYNEIAGGSRERLGALSDGIFAVAMTLLVLTLVVPTVGDVRAAGDLGAALLKLAPSLVTYVMSFLTLGIFWVGQQTQLSQLERSDRDYTWIMLAFLLFVTLVPFSTALLAAFYQSRIALVEYWFNVLVLGAAILLSAEYANRRGFFPGPAGDDHGGDPEARLRRPGPLPGRHAPVRLRHPAQHRLDRPDPAQLRGLAPGFVPAPAVRRLISRARVHRMRAMNDDRPSRGALTGKVAVVVGGAGGIGRVAATALARQGARLVIADIDSGRMERTVDEILALGTTEAAQALPTDVRSDSSVRSLAGDAVASMGRVDILLNMAGVILQGPLQKTRTADWKWVLDTNLLGSVRTALAFVPHMAQRGSGHIVNTIGSGGLEPKDPLTVPYDTAQVALASFTRSLARELAPKGVDVSLYCTGHDAPRIGQHTRSRGLGRLLHQADEVGEPAVPDSLLDPLLESLRRPRFLVKADPAGEAAKPEPATVR